MKILVEKEFRYGGETYGEGEEIDLPERVGEKVIEKGYGRKIREEGMEPAEKPPKIENTPGPTEKKTESSGKEPLTIPVKTGGKTWIDATLFFGNPRASENWKKRSQIRLQKKSMNDDGEIENEGEPFYLTPTRAINISPILQELGMKGKLHDKGNAR